LRSARFIVPLHHKNYEVNYIVTRNPDFFKNIGDYNFCSLEDMGVALRHVTGLAADSETTGLNARKDKLFAIQLGTGKDNFLIDLQDYRTSIRFREYENTTQVPSEVWPYLYDKHLVFHNGMFDLSFWMYNGFEPDPEYIWDTMIASKIKYNGKVTIRHNLRDTMEREIGVVLNKDEQKNIHKTQLTTARAIEYCFSDVDELLDLHKSLYGSLKAYGGHRTYNLNRQAIVALVYMGLCGLPCGKRQWGNKVKEDKLELSRLERELTEYIYDNLEQFRDAQLDLFSQEKRVRCLFTSPKQMIPVFKAFGINVETEDKTAATKKPKAKETAHEKSLRERGLKESIDESVIKFSNHDFVTKWLSYKEAQHTVSNFGENILDVIEDGRIYLRFNPMVDTCRISSDKELSPMNGLNIPAPKRTRECFVANPGFKMVVADYAGQENVILADKSQDEGMVYSVVHGTCLHCAFARLAFPEIANLSDDDIKKNHKSKRDYVKSPRFLKAYGGSAITMARQCGMSVEQAQFLSDSYDTLHAGVVSWGKRNLEINCARGYIESADGWRLHLPFYDEYLDARLRVERMDRDDWAMYKTGKLEQKEIWEREELRAKFPDLPPYEVKDQEASQYYKKIRPHVRKYFSRRGEYLRLTLNNPIQTTGAHQTKRALVELYKYIKANGHLWVARLANSPYDEIVMEVKEELAEQYRQVLQEKMREAGDYYLESGLVKMGADAAIGDSWYEAK